MAPASTTILHGAVGDDAPLHVPSDFRVKRCNSQADAYCDGGNSAPVTVFVDRHDQNVYQEISPGG